MQDWEKPWWNNRGYIASWVKCVPLGSSCLTRMCQLAVKEVDTTPRRIPSHKCMHEKQFGEKTFDFFSNKVNEVTIRYTICFVFPSCSVYHHLSACGILDCRAALKFRASIRRRQHSLFPGRSRVAQESREKPATPRPHRTVEFDRKKKTPTHIQL